MLQSVLVFLFFIGMIGDALTTFLGILGALGNQLGNVSLNDMAGTLAEIGNGNVNDIGNYLFACIATCVITGLNILTIDVFARKARIISFIWLPAFIVDLIASFIGSSSFIKNEANPYLAYGLVFFITIIITVSPAMLRYIIKHPIY